MDRQPEPTAPVPERDFESGIDASDIWMHAQGVVARGTATRWSTFGIWLDTPGVWAGGPDDVWIVNGRRALHWNGSDFELRGRPLAKNVITAAWGFSSSDLWAVGSGDDTTVGAPFTHFDGTTWAEDVVSQTRALHDVWGAGPRDIWSVGRGVILHHDGTGFTTTPTPHLLTGVWGSGPADVWAVGSDASGQTGKLLHFDGRAWTEQTVPTGGSLFSVTGTGPRDVWVSGRKLLLHFDGTGWRLVSAATFLDVAARAPDDLWVIGNDRADTGASSASTSMSAGCSLETCPARSFVLHWDGVRFTDVTPGFARLHVDRIWSARRRAPPQ